MHANNLQVKLPAQLVEGDTWEGLTVSCTSTGTAFASPLASATMIWTSSAGVVGLTLTSAGGDITIDNAATWDFTVDEITPFPLAAGDWSWTITCTDSAGVIKTRIAGTKRITAKG